MSDLEQRYVSKYCEASEDYYPFDTHDDQFLLLSETVQALNEKDKRIAELENSNTHAGLRTIYQKAQARIAELHKLSIELEQTNHQYIDSGHVLDPLEVIHKIKILLRAI